ncbi:endoplasmic reticulum-type calcium-transporting ATPase 3 [Prunus dulcis]|uniref:Endoplasmic reticulum-type calcium-transporting ATPase 3 n=1 Tax=Prunus dulcis TaxID=3755 RepID=A0A4Y1S049_PRUDU|nr:endoplasmic reticulum-type calcium-transporting ATPase 3 [Prunus dulcis]
MNINVASTSNIIKTLPGFRGDLLLNLKLGWYVGVGAMDDVQLFYYFFESEGSPEYDPLVLWLNGGSGCSY